MRVAIALVSTSTHSSGSYSGFSAASYPPGFASTRVGPRVRSALLCHVAVDPQRRLVPRDEWLKIQRERRVQGVALEPRHNGLRCWRVVP